MLNFEILPVGAGHFWAVLDLDQDTSDFQKWCDERQIVLEERHFWYDPHWVAFIHDDHAAEFRARFL